MPIGAGTPPAGTPLRAFVGNREPRVFSNCGKWSNPSRSHGDGAQKKLLLSISAEVPKIGIFFCGFLGTFPAVTPARKRRRAYESRFRTRWCASRNSRPPRSLPQIARFWLQFTPHLGSVLLGFTWPHTPLSRRPGALDSAVYLHRPGRMPGPLCCCSSLYFIGGKNSLRWRAPNQSGTRKNSANTKSPVSSCDTQPCACMSAWRTRFASS
jgi:hypothetical protein